MRVCCVVQCGTKASSKESIFEYDYDPTLTVLEAHLKPSKTPRSKLCICELHFENECIIRTDTKIMKDGSEVLAPRKRPRLKKNSIPTIFPKRTSIIEKTSRSSKLVCPEASTAQNTNSFLGKNRTAYVKMSINKSTPKHSIFHALDNKIGNTHLTQESVLKQEPYTAEALINEWTALFKEKKVPNHWAMMKTTLGVLFTYFGDTLGKVTRSVLVKNDLSVEVGSNGRLAKFPVIEKIACFQELYTALLTVACLRMCEGIDEHTPCGDGFYIPIPKSSSNKCRPCQITSRRKKSAEYAKAKRARSRPKKDKSQKRRCRKRKSSQQIPESQHLAQLQCNQQQIIEEMQLVHKENVEVFFDNQNEENIKQEILEENDSAQDIIHERISLETDNEKEQPHSNKRLKCSEVTSSPVVCKSESIFDIVNELTSMFPPGWCFFCHSDKVIFIRFDCDTLKERIRLEFNSDLSVTVTFLQHRQIQVDENIRSVFELLTYLNSMDEKILCSGTGFNGESYATQCPGDITNEYKCFQNNPRCEACRSLRDKLMIRERYQANN